VGAAASANASSNESLLCTVIAAGCTNPAAVAACAGAVDGGKGMSSAPVFSLARVPALVLLRRFVGAADSAAAVPPAMRGGSPSACQCRLLSSATSPVANELR